MGKITEQQAAKLIYNNLKTLVYDYSPHFELEGSSIIVSGSRYSVREGVHEGIMKLIPRGFMISPTEPIHEGTNVIRILDNTEQREQEEKFKHEYKLLSLILEELKQISTFTKELSSTVHRDIIEMEQNIS